MITELKGVFVGVILFVLLVLFKCFSYVICIYIFIIFVNRFLKLLRVLISFCLFGVVGKLPGHNGVRSGISRSAEHHSKRN